MAGKTSPRRISPLLLGGGILAIAIGFGLPLLLAGKSEAPDAIVEPGGPEGPSLGMSLARLVGCLVLVCGLCVVTTKWLHRKASAQSGPMQIVAAMRLSSRCVVQLVQAGERTLLLGMDSSGIKAILELPQQRALENTCAEPSDILPMIFPAAQAA